MTVLNNFILKVLFDIKVFICESVFEFLWNRVKLTHQRINLNTFSEDLILSNELLHHTLEPSHLDVMVQILLS